MATIDKNFKVKNGLVVEGSTATVNGDQVLTENASDQYILDLVGGVAYITSVDTDDLTVTSGQLSIAVGSDLARTGDLPTQTSDISESVGGPLYYTDGRVKDVLVNSTQTNISITEIAGELHITAENGVADSTTDNLTEGTTNKYYSDTLVDNHLSGGNAITYSAGTISVDLVENGGLTNSGDALSIDRTTVDTWYEDNGAVSSHNSDTSGVHGVNGDVVGTSDTQTLTNKTIGNTLTFNDGGADTTIAPDGDNLELRATDGQVNIYGGAVNINPTGDIWLTSNTGDITLSADGAVYYGGSTAADEVATHGYVDNAVSGLAWKQAVNLKVTSNINVAGDQVGAVFDSHDALTTADAGYRFLLTDQNTASENGIWESYVDGATLLLRRPTDADVYSELIGAAVYIMEGTQFGSTSWVQGNHYLTDFTGQDWTQFSGQGSVTAGYGISVDGLEVSVDAAVIASQQDLTDGLALKQDTLSAGTNISIVSNTVSVTGLASTDISDFNTAALSATASAYDASGAASTAETNANSYTDTQLGSYTPTSNLETTIDGYGFAYTSEIPTSTDDIAEGTFNHYYTDARAEDAAGYLLANATKDNISISYDGTSLTITAENGVGDSTTDDLTEGSTNLYFQDERAVAAIGGSNIQPASIDINTYRREEATQQYVASASTVTGHTFTGNKSVKYLVRTVGNVSGTLHSQITELLVTVDGNNNAAVTEYGTIHTSENPLATATMDYSGGEHRLRVTTAISGAEVVVAATIMSWAD